MLMFCKICKCTLPKLQDKINLIWIDCYWSEQEDMTIT